MPERTITRLKKSRTTIPKNMTDLDHAVYEIGKLNDEIDEAEAALKAKLLEVATAGKIRIDAMISRRNYLFNGAFAYAQARRNTIGEGGKTVQMASGQLGWRITPPHVECPNGDGYAIEALEKAGLGDSYIHTEKSLMRQALLKTKPSVDGIEYKQHEEFFVKPKQQTNRKPKVITKRID
jgi:phage host-nuclease inhibitor protein Gam